MGTAKRERQKANRQARLQAMQVQAKRQKTKKTGLKVGGAIVALIAVALILAFTVGKDDDNEVVAPADTTLPVDPTAPEVTAPPARPGAAITGETPCPATDGTAEQTVSFEQAPPMCIDPAKSYTASFDTSEGTVVVALDTDKTPNTVNNFVVLSQYKYYDGTVIFRTDPSIDIIQGGGFDNMADPGYSIEDEGSGFTYTEGDLVMARTGEPNSAGGQFFFATGPNVSLLDGQGTYVTFGQVTEGLDVLKTIIGLHQEDPTSGLGGAPSRAVTINSVTITES